MTRTILLADDSVTIQKVVELTFLDEEYRVVAVGNGADAIDRLAEVEPDIVLADVHMPGADGYELCAAARGRYPGVPVLLLVGTFEVFDAERASAAGAAGHLKKPFDSQELLRQVKDLVDEAAGAAQETAAPEPEEDTTSPAATMAVAADEGASWSFEPSQEAGAASREASEIAAETWGGAEPPEFEAIEDAPAAASTAELESASEPPASAAEAPAAAPEAVPAAPVAAAASLEGLSEEDVDRIARRVVELLGDKPVRDVAWEVVPDLAEVLLKARIRELEASVE